MTVAAAAPVMPIFGKPNRPKIRIGSKMMLMTAPVVWIAGGKDKGNDYSVLYELVRKKVKALVCMGLHNEKLIESFSPLCKVFDTDNLEDAVKAARNCAEPGDVVLLSPCCASFDLFRSYEHRGEMFKQEVRK